MPGDRQKNRKKQHNLDRPPAWTTIGEPKVKEVKVRGGGKKLRALQLNQGNFSLGSSGITRRCRIIKVLYSPDNDQYATRGVITKGCVVKIDVGGFGDALDPQQDILARISTSPGQCGKADGYVLEAEELLFYLQKING